MIKTSEQIDSTSNNQILGTLVADLYAVESLNDRFDRYANTIESLGFDAVCYSFIPATSLISPDKLAPIFKHSSNFPLSFLTQYEADNFYCNDFTIREVQENNLSPKDWKKSEESGKLSKEECNVIKIAREQHGIKNALSLATMNDASGISGVSIISFKEDAEFKSLKKKYLHLIENCSQFFNDLIMLQSRSHVIQTFVSPQIPPITPKEKVVLKGLVTGTPIKKIGEEENMSHSSVSNHLQRLRKKFHVQKTTELQQLLQSLNILGDL